MKVPVPELKVGDLIKTSLDCAFISKIEEQKNCVNLHVKTQTKLMRPSGSERVLCYWKTQRVEVLNRDEGRWQDPTLKSSVGARRDAAGEDGKT